MLSKSTKNSIRRVISQDDHWNHLFMFVFSKAIWLKVIDQKDQFSLKFLMYQHNRIRKLHEIQHRVYLQKIHQNFYIWEQIKLLYFDWFYQAHSEERDKKLHNMKILYQLNPIYHQRKTHFPVEVLLHT